MKLWHAYLLVLATELSQGPHCLDLFQLINMKKCYFLSHSSHMANATATNVASATVAGRADNKTVPSLQKGLKGLLDVAGLKLQTFCILG